MPRKIIVVGGGPAGIEAAKAAARAGGQVTLISEGPVGGRAGWHSLLPSKVWLTAADTAGLVAETPSLRAGERQSDPAAIVAEIQAVKERWNEQQLEELKTLGVEIVNGVASFESPHQLVVKDEEGREVSRLHGQAVIVSAGSVPFFPPDLRPNGKNILAPRFASKLNPLPESVVVIGAGATGSEFTYLFNRLGVEVTWIVDPYGVLPLFAPQAGQVLAEILVRRGVKIVEDQFADRIDQTDGGVTVLTSKGERYPAAMAFVAIGRKPDLSRLNLEATGLGVTAGQAPQVDAFGQTAVKGLYAVGDAAGAPMVANRAMAQARVAGLHAAGATPAPFRPETVIAAIYTEPQVAQVGAVTGNGIEMVQVPFGIGLKTHLLPEEEGLVALAYNPERQVVGGVAVGSHAADVLAPVALAIQLNASLDDMASLYPAHPTVSELAFLAARMA
jgi:dihydrolipoamide dehydrogenase